MRCLAIDVGYSATKIVDAENNRFLFPSLVKGYVSDGLSLDDGHPVLGFRDKEFIVGDSHEGGEINVSENFHGSESWEVLMCWAFYQYARRQKESDIYIDRLCIGLPYSQYYKEKFAQVNKKHFMFSVDDKEFNIEIENLYILPQGKAVLLSLGDIERLTTGSVGILDIGYYTLDMVCFKDGQIVRSRSESVPAGISKVYSEMERVIKAKLRTSKVSSSVIRKVLKEKKLVFRRNEYDFRKDVQIIINRYWDTVLSSCTKCWENEMDFMNPLLVAGGGAEFLRGYLNSGFQAVSNAVYSNAIGYMQYVKSVGNGRR